jgi:hypothetical protein
MEGSRVRRVGFKEWRKPLEEAAKKRGVKLSRKNMNRLHSAFTTWALKQYGTDFNTLVWACYEDVLEDMFLSASLEPLLFRRMSDYRTRS